MTILWMMSIRRRRMKLQMKCMQSKNDVRRKCSDSFKRRRGENGMRREKSSGGRLGVRYYPMEHNIVLERREIIISMWIAVTGGLKSMPPKGNGVGLKKIWRMLELSMLWMWMRLPRGQLLKKKGNRRLQIDFVWKKNVLSRRPNDVCRRQSVIVRWKRRRELRPNGRLDC
jgi:hypothetical protein